MEGQAWEESRETAIPKTNENGESTPEQTELEAVYRERESLQALREELLSEKKEFENEVSKFQRRMQEEQNRLNDEKLFFKKKMDILKGGFAQLEADRKAFERERIRTEEQQKIILEEKTDKSYGGVKMFFKGVSNPLTLKKRYKDLIKIFHPDNLCGDTDVLQMINGEYERLQEKIGWQKKA